MRDLMLASCSLAAVLAVIVAIRTVHRREPDWKLHSGALFGIAALAILSIVSQEVQSPTLDLVDVGFALAFMAYLLCVWTVRTRSDSKALRE